MVLLTAETVEQLELNAASRKRKTRSSAPASPPQTPETLAPEEPTLETPDKVDPPAIHSETQQDEEAPTPTCKRARVLLTAETVELVDMPETLAPEEPTMETPDKVDPPAVHSASQHDKEAPTPACQRARVCDGAAHTDEACPTMAVTPEIGETCLSKLVLDEGPQTDEAAANAAVPPEKVDPPATQDDTEQRNDAPIDASQQLGETLAMMASPQRATLRSSSTTSAGNQPMGQSPSRTSDEEPFGYNAARPPSSACTTADPDSQDSMAVPVGVASNGETGRRCDMCSDGTAELHIVGIVSTRVYPCTPLYPGPLLPSRFPDTNSNQLHAGSWYW
jgi:hypothetical protein